MHAIIDYQNHLYSAKFVYTNKEFDTGTLYSQHMKCFKYAILNMQFIDIQIVSVIKKRQKDGQYE